ncbi:MAG: CBS domain-containing protein [Acetobacteraceae bacterium]|nr:CBS domain-containing protein [Acetobacteraceae bacterium]MBV8520786.1 CBS domain-containing protein [Acetobacteraceae bacterium]MBV8591005.1 CBS domain-containing protein [Acetobacteraceae bacterium]
MTTIATILKHKGHEVISVSPELTVSDVIHTLSERRIGAVLLQDGPKIGIVSERDIIHAFSAHGAATLQMKAREIMTRNVQTATPETSIRKAMEMMTEGRFRHIPVLDHGKLVGLVSIGDVVKARIMEQESEVDSLKAYVVGAA